MSKPVISLDDKIDKEQTLGTLIVVILKARNLHDKHTFRKQDVFAQATLNGIEKRTQVDIKGGQHPVWDSELRFTIMKNATAKYRKLEVGCYAKEPRSDDLLGKCVVDISETVRTGEFDDWVDLEVEGAKRGDVYLEMTYFSNAPPPVSQTAAPNNKLLAQVLNPNNLQRRPSKLSHADRLSRPVQQGPPTPRPGYAPPGPSKLAGSPSYTPPKQPYQNLPASNHGAGLPASLTPSRPSGTSPKGRNDTLPGLPAQVGRDPGAQAQGAATLPSILRPGPTPVQNIPLPQQQQYGHYRHPSTSPPSNPGYYGPQHGSSPPGSNPYIGGGGGSGSSTPVPAMAPNRVYTPLSGPTQQPSLPVSVPAQNPYVYASSPPPPAGAPLLWQGAPAPAQGPSGGFSFPVPVVPAGGPSYTGPPSGPSGYNGYGAYPQPSRVGDDRGREELDPYLQNRYQSPLPLPSGAESRPAPPPSANLAPPETPPPAWSPATPPKDSEMDRRREAEQAALRKRHEEEENKERRERERKEKEQNDREARERATRIREQQEYERDVARKREQEKRDLELAMELDRELNLEETMRVESGPTRTAASMPGYW